MKSLFVVLAVLVVGLASFAGGLYASKFQSVQNCPCMGKLVKKCCCTDCKCVDCKCTCTDCKCVDCKCCCESPCCVNGKCAVPKK